MKLKDLERTQDDLSNIDIKFEGKDGVITGNAGDMITKINENLSLIGRYCLH